jgi:ribosomal protein L23
MVKEKLYTLIKAPIITEQTAQLGENLNKLYLK